MPQPGQPDTRAEPQPESAGAQNSTGQAQTRAEARARQAAQGSSAAPATEGLPTGQPVRRPDGPPAGQPAHRPTAQTEARPTGLTRPPVAGELAYESTITAPTEWVPYVYTTAEIQTHPIRRGLSVAAVVCGSLSMLAGIFVVWAVPLALAAVVLALVARFVERRSGGLWILGLVTGLVGILLGVVWLVVITQVLPPYFG
ncbi:hypothetical protein [Cryobacterium arcticum]|uniref:DUF4190 domain-containing protein n=1 Tax=Cryobacterium arcticum TaxID=670052 RepID=A0A1B1BMS0_9MICO|nr:hypothetical protein [Cryobacterium arcticum]ANP73845.1 hypothetical protein PA27867_2907 [Cryobacterium arcticum]